MPLPPSRPRRSRDLGTGALQHLQTLAESDVSGLRFAIPPHSALLTYALVRPTGALTLLQDASDTTGVDSVDGAAAVAVGPSGTSIYVAAYRDDAVTVFMPEPGAPLLGAARLGALVAVRRRR